MAALTSTGLNLSPNQFWRLESWHTCSRNSPFRFFFSFFAEGLRRFLGQHIFSVFFHFCQHNFMEREYQWDRFGCLIKSRSVGYFPPPFLFIFSYPFHLSLNNLSAQAFLCSLFSLSFIPSFPSLSCIPPCTRPSAICSAEWGYFIIWLEVSAFT